MARVVVLHNANAPRTIGDHPNYLVEGVSNGTAGTFSLKVQALSMMEAIDKAKNKLLTAGGDPSVREWRAKSIRYRHG